MDNNWIPKKRNYLKKFQVSIPQVESEEQSQPRPQEYGVVFYPVRCPKSNCRSKNNRCYKSTPPIRYHICNDCGYRFKSRESDE